MTERSDGGFGMVRDASSGNAWLTGRKARRSMQALTGVAVVAILAASTIPVRGAPGTIVIEPGVPRETAADYERAVDLSLLFFSQTYGLRPAAVPRIVVVPDTDRYIAALMRELQVDRAEAERRSRTSTVWGSARAIVVNAKGEARSRERVFDIATVIAAQVFTQVAKPHNPFSVYWLAQGGADVLGARVVETSGLFSVDAYRRVWLDILRRTQSRPDLAVLQDREGGWYAAFDRYGNSVIYDTARTAVLRLIDRAGYGPLMTYFRGLSAGRDPAQVFQEAFGVSLETFMADYRSYLTAEMQR